MLIEIEKSGRYRNSYAIELLGLCDVFTYTVLRLLKKSFANDLEHFGRWIVQGRGYDCQVLGCTRFCSSTLGC